MEAAPTSSSSKVIIQCTDPSNVFDAFQERLEPRAPLKNLHWKSPLRPLRSIPSLNISLTLNETSQKITHPNARRHQIPGLRETPYVKLYLLRCDDKETYKETARKDVKQWIRENTFEKESKSALKNQEHHDAFEWMIVHVVLPGTQASSQPQSSKHISLNDTESTDSVNSKSKWTGKSTSTIHDKLRADFSSSKLPIPRIAQVRILDPAKPPGALGPSDVEEQWRDFVDNLKASILKSFNTRVAQYEDDIREREAQRALPGWNFCTFFILKEGLARGFESVGLLEDALAVYSELELGLDAVVQQSRDENDLSGALLPYSKDLKSKIREALDQEVHDSNGDLSTPQLTQVLARDSSTSPFDAEKRRLRELILANDVSPLDIRTYIFTRQMEILLRQAKVSATNSKVSSVDLEIMADLADLALNFINLGSRELRMDMQSAWGGRLPGEERAIQKVVIGNVVASWTWAAVLDILSYMLPHADLDLTQFDDRNDVLEEEAQLPESSQKSEEVRPGSSHSSRTSSPHHGFRSESLSSNVIPSRDLHNQPANSTFKRPGTDHMCSTTAKLFLLLRKTVENLPAITGWVEEIRRASNTVNDGAAKVHLHRLTSTFTLSAVNGDVETHLPDAVIKYRLRALDSSCLKHTTSSREAFQQIHRLLSKVMHHLFVRANSRHSARQVLIDMAMLAFTQQDFSFARQCIGTILAADSGEPIVTAQPHVLSMYAECLRKEDSPNDLAICLIELLQIPTSTQSPSVAQRYCDELVEVAKRTSGLVLPFDTLFDVVKLDRHISHGASPGGFAVALSLRTTCSATIVGEGLTLRLRSASHAEPQTIELRGSESLQVSRAPAELQMQSHALAEGWYNMEELEVRVGNILLRKSLSHSENRPSVADYKPMLTASDAVPLLLYQSSKTPRLSLSQSTMIDLEKTRTLILEVQTASDDLDECTLFVRPGTAGLRLQLLDATATVDDQHVSIRIEHDSRGTACRLGHLSENKVIEIAVPYSIESQAESTVSIKCILEYQHDGVTYSMHQNCSTDVRLPLSVSVEDIYRPEHWYSTFLLATATPSPVEVTDCRLDESRQIHSSTDKATDMECIVFGNQPARWVAKLSRAMENIPVNTALKLNIRYRRVDEAIVAALRAAFEAAAGNAGFHGAVRILSDHLIAMLRQKWTEHDLELIALTSAVGMWPKADIDWQQVLPAFEGSRRANIDDWLTRWHTETSSIPLELKSTPMRELRLKAGIRPSPPVVTVDLQVHLTVGQTTAVLGQPLICSLSINVPTVPEDPTEVTYELFAQADAWLVGGRKKGTISSGLNEQSSVVLFPQRSGRLLLPSIDIRCRKISTATFQNGDQGVEIPVEVYNKAVSTSIHVTPSLRSSTIGLTVADPTAGNAGNTSGPGTLLQNELR